MVQMKCVAIISAIVFLVLLRAARHHKKASSHIIELVHGHIVRDSDKNQTLLRSSITRSPSASPPNIVVTPVVNKSPASNKIVYNITKIENDKKHNIPHEKPSSLPSEIDELETNGSILDMYLAVIVLTARDYKKRRIAIRETWGKGHSNVYFIVGKHCPYKPKQRKSWVCEPKNENIQIDEQYNEEQEALTHKLSLEPNVIVVDMIDVYRNLAEKLKLAYMWLYKHTNAKYILKMDDDSFARVDSVAYWLTHRKPKSKYEIIAGGFSAGSPSRSGKWAETKFKANKYPPWPSGAGHIVSRPVIEYMYKHVDTWVSYQGEDTSMGIWMEKMRSQMNVERVTSLHFITHSGDCHNKKRFVIGHQISISKMKSCFANMDEYKHVAEALSKKKIEPREKAEWKNEIDLVITSSLGSKIIGDRQRMRTDDHSLYWVLISISKNAPWVRNIFILVNSEIELPYKLPSNLNIKILNRCNYMKHCPSMNSMAVQTMVHKIPELSEHFIYVEDDTMLGRSVTPDVFFSDGKPFAWQKKPTWFDGIGGEHHRIYINPSVFKGKTPTSACPCGHWWYPMLKSYAIELSNTYADWYKFVESHQSGRFSSQTNSINDKRNSQEEEILGVWSSHLIKSGRGVYKNIIKDRGTMWDEATISKSGFSKIINDKPVFMNVNDRFSKNPKKYTQQIKWFWDAMEKLFNVKMKLKSSQPKQIQTFQPKQSETLCKFSTENEMFRRVLVIVMFNHEKYIRDNFKKFKELYSSVFPNIKFCSPKKFPNNDESIYAPLYNGGTSKPRFAEPLGSLTYQCTLFALRDYPGQFDGYLSVGDDILMNIPRISTMPLTEMWLEPEDSMRFSTKDMQKTGGKFNLWKRLNPGGAKSSLNVEKDSHLDPRFKKLLKKNGWFHASADIYYFPASVVESFNHLAPIFLNNKIYFSNAIATIMHLIEDDSASPSVKIIPLHGVSKWYYHKDRLDWWKHLPPIVGKADYYHPLKYSSLKKASKSRLKTLCSFVNAPIPQQATPIPHQQQNKKPSSTRCQPDTRFRKCSWYEEYSKHVQQIVPMPNTNPGLTPHECGTWWHHTPHPRIIDPPWNKQLVISRQDIPKCPFGQNVNNKHKCSSQYQKVFKALNKLDVIYFPRGGTELGVVRSSGYIKHDGDIDIFVNMPQEMLYKKLSGQLQGIHISGKGHPASEVHFSSSGCPTIHMVYNDAMQDKMNHKAKSSDLCTCYMNSISILCHKNAQKRLYTQYGPTWNLPLYIKALDNGNWFKTHKKHRWSKEAKKKLDKMVSEGNTIESFNGKKLTALQKAQLNLARGQFMLPTATFCTSTVKKYVADPSINAPSLGCKVSKGVTLKSKWSQNDCAMVPLENRLRLELLSKILKDTTRILTKYMPSGSVPPLLAGGTLLGAVRSQNLLPWTKDADLNISPALYSMLDNNMKMRKEFFDAGYIIFKHLGCGRVCAHTNHKDIESFGTWGKCGSAKYFYYEKGVTFVDMYKAVIKKNQKVVTKQTKYCKSLVWNDFLPPQKINMLGTQFYVPSKSSTMMCKLWGEDWRTPVKGDSMEPFCNSQAERCEKLELDVNTLKCKRNIYELVDVIRSAAQYGITIFPRSGFLLGIARQSGFLSHERKDADMGILYSDLPRIKKYGDNIKSYSFPGLSYKFKLEGMIEKYSTCLYSGKMHNQEGRYEAYQVTIIRNDGTQLTGKNYFDTPAFVFPYNSTHYFYPIWCLKGYNDKQLIRESRQYNAKGASRINLKTGERKVSLGADNGVVFEKKIFSSTVKVPFYDTLIDLPVGYKDICKAQYGDWQTPRKRDSAGTLRTIKHTKPSSCKKNT